jgi:hypothetical protein
MAPCSLAQGLARSGKSRIDRHGVVQATLRAFARGSAKWIPRPLGRRGRMRPGGTFPRRQEGISSAMVSSKAQTVDDYLAQLPSDRRAVVAAVRDHVNAHLPPGYVEAMACGMIGWGVPLSRYPRTYNGEPLSYVGLAAQKNNYSLYLMGCYMNPADDAALRAAYAKAGRKLDMGKSCLRFKSLDGLLLDEIGRLVAAIPVETFIARYESVKRP